MRHGEFTRGHAGEVLREFRRLYGIFFPGKRETVEESQKPRVPLVPAERPAAPEISPADLPAPGGNVPAPAPETPGVGAQKFPVATKKIGKVFGEDDL